MTGKITFFEGWSWFRLNYLTLALAMALKYYTSVAKVHKPIRDIRFSVKYDLRFLERSFDLELLFDRKFLLEVELLFGLELLLEVQLLLDPQLLLEIELLLDLELL